MFRCICKLILNRTLNSKVANHSTFNFCLNFKTLSKLALHLLTIITKLFCISIIHSFKERTFSSLSKCLSSCSSLRRSYQLVTTF